MIKGDQAIIKSIEINKDISKLDVKDYISDGSHSFKELYYTRAIQFAVICNAFKDYAWKSLKHAEGESPMYDDYFIVGLEMPDGTHITYHEPLTRWHMFDVKEVPNAPKYDNVNSTKVVERFNMLL